MLEIVFTQRQELILEKMHRCTSLILNDVNGGPVGTATKISGVALHHITSNSISEVALHHITSIARVARHIDRIPRTHLLFKWGPKQAITIFTEKLVKLVNIKM